MKETINNIFEELFLSPSNLLGIFVVIILAIRMLYKYGVIEMMTQANIGEVYKVIDKYFTKKHQFVFSGMIYAFIAFKIFIDIK